MVSQAIIESNKTVELSPTYVSIPVLIARCHICKHDFHKMSLWCTILLIHVGGISIFYVNKLLILQTSIAKVLQIIVWE